MSLTRSDIASGLKDLGLVSGDSVLVHSSLSSLGRVTGGAETVVEAFLEVLGPDGTLLVPTFGDLGAIPEAVKRRADVIHSIHPKASVAAVGGRARELCENHWKPELAHGENTPYVRLAEIGGYVCLMGVDQDRNTTLHTVESLLRLSYLKTTDSFTFATPEGEVTKSWPFFPGPHRDFIRLDRVLQMEGILSKGRIGNSTVRLMKSREMIDCLMEIGQRDSAFALCANPNCNDCVTQRSDLRREPFVSETFSVAVSARLAGETIGAIVDGCRSAETTTVELDYLDDKPIGVLDSRHLCSIVRELRLEGLNVASLRGTPSEGNSVQCIKLASECGVGRVVVPLLGDIKAVALSGADAGVNVCFYNVGTTSDAVLSSMKSLRADGQMAGLTFSAANFVRVGERPFIKSYLNKLKRFINQLDVEDCTFDGVSTPLAGGNAEIKELVSILRCSNFSGQLTLGAGNREVSTLRSTVVQFENLLLSM